MKLGPVHLVTDATMAWMQGMLRGLAETLAGANLDRVRLNRRLSEVEAERDQLLERLAEPAALSHRLLHNPAFVRCAPHWLLEPDADDQRTRDAVERITRAYQRAQREAVSVAPGMWTHAEERNADFLDALERGDVTVAQAQLARLFQSRLINGLGQFHENMLPQIRSRPIGNHIQVRFTDTLVSLAEAVGATRLTSAEQDADRHVHALDVDIDAVFSAIRGRTALELTFPQVGGAYGCIAAKRQVTTDSLLHGYTLWRLRQLGALANDRVAEIGGGYGCLAELCFRHGLRRYAIYDLPWVNALQSYFLIMALPPGSVRLLGETAGDLEVLPFWRFHELPPRSVEFVVNTDSLPEMARNTACEYIDRIQKVTRRLFLSINQEAKAPVEGFGRQQCVAELVEAHGGFTRLSRQRHWLKQGYVEEVFGPVSKAS